MAMRLIVIALLLTACGTEEQPRERIQVMGPYGYYKALQNKEACGKDPACICGLAEEDRPEFLYDPATGDARDPGCP